MQKLEDKVAVITGGSSGIGLATAKRFVEEGAYVVITGRRKEELEEAAASIGRNVTTVVGDVSRLDDLDRLYAAVKEKHGHIDILFANARAGTIAPLAVATEAHFDQIFDVNVKGVGVLHGAEGSSPLQRWRFYHPDVLGLERVGAAGVQRLCREQGRCAQLRARLDIGAERPQNPRECDEPRTNRDSRIGDNDGPYP
jgi:NAD(P)-dependent dehydrogenase (short-subunit alcohol dehydrogenase family)